MLVYFFTLNAVPLGLFYPLVLNYIFCGNNSGFVATTPPKETESLKCQQSKSPQGSAHVRFIAIYNSSSEIDSSLGQKHRLTGASSVTVS